MTSTPRVEPMRHGVHLPHDSLAQNSIANRAMRGHVHRVVEDDEPAVADHRAGLRERLVVHRQVEAGRRQVRARAARPPARPGPAARMPCRPRSPSTSVAERHAEPASTMPPRAMLPASWKTWVPRERPVPSAAYASPPSASDHRHGPEGQHVVDDGRPAEQPLEGRDRRLGAHLAALALELSSIEVSSPQM